MPVPDPTPSKRRKTRQTPPAATKPQTPRPARPKQPPAAQPATAPQKTKPKPAPVTHPATLSRQGVAMVARFEGLRHRAYNDAAQPTNATIGIGHLLHKGPCTVRDRLVYWTTAKCYTVFLRDAGWAVAAVKLHTDVSLTQPQFDALVSFVFNVGEGAFAASTLLRHLNAGGYQQVPADLMQWDHAGSVVLAGLEARRRGEGACFAHGDYGD